EAGVRMDDPATGQRACATATTLRAFSDNPNDPNLELKNVVLFNNGGTPSTEIQQGAGAVVCNAQQWLTALNAINNVQPAPVTDTGPNPGITVAPYPTSPTTTQYIPAPGGPLDGSGAATNCQALDPSWMDAKTYLGAFEPGNTTPGDAGNWMNTGIPTQWVNFNTN